MFVFKNQFVANLAVGDDLKNYLADLRQKLVSIKYDFPESFLVLPKDVSYIQQIKKTAAEYQNSNWQKLFLIGIGGSNLGTWAIWDALRRQSKKEIVFVETTDPLVMGDVVKSLEFEYNNGRQALVVLVSKTGTTTESIANFSVILENLKKLDKDYAKRIIVLTEENTPLWQYAAENNFPKLSIPKIQGGRYTVFTSVGFLPLALVRIDIDKILKGAAEITDACLNEDVVKNPALSSALTIFKSIFKEGRVIHDSFIFSVDLWRWGYWYRQLIAEGLGKRGRGITPTVSLGSTDLHSMAQLYLGGPADKFTTFISVKNFKKDFSIIEAGLNKVIAGLEGKSLVRVMSAILEGVKDAYRQSDLPFVEIELDEINEENLGALMQMKMMETIILGKLMGVNAFDQPAIDLYKEETRKRL